MSKRRILIAANWKMHKTLEEARILTREVRRGLTYGLQAEVALAPPFTALAAVAEELAGSDIRLAGQDTFWERQGAYTGAISPVMLKDVGCHYVIIGHSERRQYFGETDETVFKKTIAALDAGLKPIVCVGERLEERESGATETVCGGQFTGGIAGLTLEQFAKIVIAYEPVWAIGTGKTATPEIASDTHRFVRGEIRKRFGAEAAGSCRILYGGSVKPDNIKGLMAQPEIDGALVGGASLDPASFAAIVNF